MPSTCFFLLAIDVVNYLTSRHGIRLDEDTVRQKIVTDLAGNLNSDQLQVIDIAQLASMLMLPHFKKIADSDDDDKIQNLFGKGLKLLLADVSNDSRWYPNGHTLGAKPVLSAALLKVVFALHGECDVPPQVLKEMVNAAGGEQQTLDLTTLILAATSDLIIYDVESEQNIATSHYDDATSIVHAFQERGSPKSDEETNANDTRYGPDGTRILPRQFTASNIDFTAETYAYRIWAALVWMLIIVPLCIRLYVIGAIRGCVPLWGETIVFLSKAIFSHLTCDIPLFLTFCILSFVD
jgi:hypothetical protein